MGRGRNRDSRRRKLGCSGPRRCTKSVGRNDPYSIRLYSHTNRRTRVHRSRCRGGIASRPRISTLSLPQTTKPPFLKTPEEGGLASAGRSHAAARLSQRTLATFTTSRTRHRGPRAFEDESPLGRAPL